MKTLFWAQMMLTLRFYYPEHDCPFSIDLDELTFTAWTGRMWTSKEDKRFLV